MYENIITAAVLIAALSAAVGVGIFVGKTRTRLKHVEGGLKNLKDKDLVSLSTNLREFSTLNDSNDKKELDGMIKELATHIEHMHEEIQRQDNMIVKLNNYWLDNVSILLRLREHGDKNVKSDSA